MTDGMRIWLINLALAVCAASADAQTPPAASSADDGARRVLMLALDNIQRGRCEGMQPCAPATAAEKANPPLTIAEAKAVIDRGVFSGAGEHCGLDWQKLNFVPMMTYWRTIQKETERQMTLIAILHGIMQEQAKQAVAQRGPCTQQIRQDLEARLSFRP